MLVVLSAKAVLERREPLPRSLLSKAEKSDVSMMGFVDLESGTPRPQSRHFPGTRPLCAGV